MAQYCMGYWVGRFVVLLTLMGSTRSRSPALTFTTSKLGWIGRPQRRAGNETFDRLEAHAGRPANVLWRQQEPRLQVAASSVSAIQPRSAGSHNANRVVLQQIEPELMKGCVFAAGGLRERRIVMQG